MVHEKRRLFLVTTLDQGGLETYLLRFLQYDNHKHYNIVLCKSGKSGVLHDQFVRVADEVILFHLGYFSIIDFIRFKKLLRDKKVTTVCDFTGNFAGIPLLIVKIAKVAKRITFYRGSTNHFKSTLWRNFYNFLVNKLVLYSSTKILSNSQAAFDYFFSKVDNRFEVIYNGIDLSTLPANLTKKDVKNSLGFTEEDYVVGHVGRCNVAKNHDTIMSVAGILCQRYKQMHFVFIGEGVSEKYNEYFSNKEFKAQIHFLGYRNDVLNLLPAFDVFYFPSLTEGQPNALIEAMMMGIPIVASDIPPIKETVPSDFLSLLLPPCDVNAAVILLEKMFKGQIDLTPFVCKEWARKRFDALKMFEKFQCEL